MDADIEEAAPGSHEDGRCFLIHASYANWLKHPAPDDAKP